MEKGDISSQVASRIIVVFDGLIGRLDNPVDAAKEKAFRKARMWKRAAHCWTIDPLITKQMWDWVWRREFGLDVATYVRPMAYAQAIEALLDEYGLPIGHMHYVTAEELVGRLAIMPYVERIFYAQPGRPFIYGGKGVYVPGSNILWT